MSLLVRSRFPAPEERKKENLKKSLKEEKKIPDEWNRLHYDLC